MQTCEVLRPVWERVENWKDLSASYLRFSPGLAFSAEFFDIEVRKSYRGQVSLVLQFWAQHLSMTNVSTCRTDHNLIQRLRR